MISDTKHPQMKKLKILKKMGNLRNLKSPFWVEHFEFWKTVIEATSKTLLYKISRNNLKKTVNNEFFRENPLFYICLFIKLL